MQYQTPDYFIAVPSLFNNKRFQDNSGWETTATDAAYLCFSGGTTISLGDNLTVDPVFIYRVVPNSPNLFSGTVALNVREQFSIGAATQTTTTWPSFLPPKTLMESNLVMVMNL